MTHDLAIIGAGPAGMAAAVEARALGLSVLLVDEQPAPGGQIFRAVEAAHTDPALGADYAAGHALAQSFRHCGVSYRPGTTLWHLNPEDGVLSLTPGGPAQAHRVLLATGAQERPVPIPGWTLPGVLTAGAAQIMLKTTGAVPRGRTVLAGQGPLLWLLAAQLKRTGAPPALIVETTPKGRWRAALRAGGWLAGSAQLAKGLGLLLACRGIPVVRAATGLRAEGQGRVQRLAWAGGSTECDTLLLHEGVIPATHIPLALGLEHDWNAAQFCWRPTTTPFGASSHPRIAVAGDGAGIGGWQAAVASGQLAALDAAHRLGRLTAEGLAQRAAPLLAMRAQALALRPFLDALYAPGPAVLAPPEDATLACRCEEVTAGQVRAAARLGATGPNQTKAFLRAGMGACQGRMCGPTVCGLVAETQTVPLASIAPLRPRAPYKPLTVGQMAGD